MSHRRRPNSNTPARHIFLARIESDGLLSLSAAVTTCILELARWKTRSLQRRRFSVDKLVQFFPLIWNLIIYRWMSSNKLHIMDKTNEWMKKWNVLRRITTVHVTSTRSVYFLLLTISQLLRVHASVVCHSLSLSLSLALARALMHLHKHTHGIHSLVLPSSTLFFFSSTDLLFLSKYTTSIRDDDIFLQ